MTRQQVKAFRHDTGVLAGLFGASLSNLTYRDAFDLAHEKLHVKNSRSNIGYITTVVARERTTLNPCQDYVQSKVREWWSSDDPNISLSDFDYDQRIIELSRRALGSFCDLHPSLRISGRDRRQFRRHGYLDGPALDRIALKITNYSASTHRAKSRFDCTEEQTWQSTDSSLNRTRLSRNPVHHDQIENLSEGSRRHFMDFSYPSEENSDSQTVFRLLPSRRSQFYSGPYPTSSEPPALDLVRHTSSKPDYSPLFTSKKSLDIPNPGTHPDDHVPCTSSASSSVDPARLDCTGHSFHSFDDLDKHIYSSQSHGLFSNRDSPAFCTNSAPVRSYASDDYLLFPRPSPPFNSPPSVNARSTECFDESPGVAPYYDHTVYVHDDSFFHEYSLENIAHSTSDREDIPVNLEDSFPTSIPPSTHFMLSNVNFPEVDSFSCELDDDGKLMNPTIEKSESKSGNPALIDHDDAV